ncbi:MAG: 50S ribosomal protein L21 [Candidatus Colwellbacteria bacterium CG10_big_fil_rev_8_21_14_0_10_42_22]|uniref:Large ribosomal subunit protein bL21 n=1 Tax=Candidatus Colwellbacteria bacterium CG10_big_fil_rev_8_21_14_0_10_42_22 TaxID=1974540 RepID=A0A2H0VF57_9BACT|nr:MAG: 50S ribosomal protein L21 [Candidatus Colwellbacteria bacterium CG10_big_fil_rev_8_21_14_0_10_42_22]
MSQFAVIETGSKQYRVEVGQKIKVEKLEAEEGADFVFDRVLLIDDGKDTKIGTPYLEKAKVEAKILGDKRGKKVVVFKYKPKKRYRVKGGHRQTHTELEITKITG